MAASMCLSLPSSSQILVLISPPALRASCSPSSTSRHRCCRSSFTVSTPVFSSLICRRRKSQVVRMAPQEERMTERNPLDFPSEWGSQKYGRKREMLPKFSPMKTPLPPPTPQDNPLEDEVFGEEEEEEQPPPQEEGEKEEEEEEEQLSL